ncbi:MAG: DEAD/DEAH box helicase [Clostridiales bacterium]|nr:DEAD/DEAH box helicase [Clostridiales bacterium]
MDCMMTFNGFDLAEGIQRAIDQMGFTEATAVQEEVIPVLREGRDLVAQSQTGTGKTLAFAIPALERIDPAIDEVQVLILCPTRELAQQCCAEVKKLTRFMRDIWPVDVYGGASMDRQIMLLRKCNMVIGTPGRVMDHMRRGTLSTRSVKLVILDEADEMLSMGFREDIEVILKDIPEERQIGLFSATMPPAILSLAETFMHEPVNVHIHAEQVTLDAIEQTVMDVPLGRKLDALNLVLHAYEPKRCMLFVNTKIMADEIQAFLNKNGWASEAIHGDMNQSQRTRVMEGFKSSRIPILVATDVAARGIDVQDVDHVINFDIPKNGEIYVHRIGRTGRAGKLGHALTMASGRRQMMEIREIERFTRSSIAVVPIPSVADIRLKLEERNADRIREKIGEGPSERHIETVRKLWEEGIDPAVIAAAALDLAFRHEADGLVDIPLPKREPQRDRVAQRRLTLNVGRRNGVTTKHIVASIADHADIPGSTIGKIEIYENKTVVGLPQDAAMKVLGAMRGVKLCGIRLTPALISDRTQRREKDTQPPRRAQHVRQARGSEKEHLLDGNDLKSWSVRQERMRARSKGRY